MRINHKLFLNTPAARQEVTPAFQCHSSSTQTSLIQALTNSVCTAVNWNEVRCSEVKWSEMVTLLVNAMCRCRYWDNTAVVMPTMTVMPTVQTPAKMTAVTSNVIGCRPQTTWLGDDLVHTVTWARNDNAHTPPRATQLNLDVQPGPAMNSKPTTYIHSTLHD